MNDVRNNITQSLYRKHYEQQLNNDEHYVEQVNESGLSPAKKVTYEIRCPYHAVRLDTVPFSVASVILGLRLHWVHDSIYSHRLILQDSPYF